MLTYKYRGRATNGERIEGSVQAPDLPAALAQVRSQGSGRIETLLPVRRPRSAAVRIDDNDLALLYQQLADALASGLPLPDAARVLARENPDRRIRAIMHQVWEELCAGQSLSAALERFPGVFPPLHRRVVRAGEEANALDAALDQLADHTDTMTRAAGSLASALTYPAVVGMVGLSLISFLLLFVVPKFMMMLNELGVREMPFATRALLAASRLYLPILFWMAVAAVLVYLLTFYRATRRGSITVDRWKLRLPVLGPFLLNLTQARVASTLAVLVQHGVSLPEAIRAAAAAAGNRVIESSLQRAAGLVEEGESVSEALEHAGAAPEVLTSRAAVGEASGNLPEALRKAAQYHATRARATAAQIGPALEPTFIIILAFCVGLIVIGMFQPLIAVISSLSGGD